MGDKISKIGDTEWKKEGDEIVFSEAKVVKKRGTKEALAAKKKYHTEQIEIHRAALSVVDQMLAKHDEL